MLAVLGLLVPGLGQLARREIVAAALVFLGVTVPFLWTALIANQLVNERIRIPSGQPPATILDPGLMDGIRTLGGLPPELMVLLALALALHVGAAVLAWRGARLRSV